MKAVILCGGRGTRLGEHGATVPKALIKIGGKPIIEHLLEIYSSYNINEFILCLGFLGSEIKRYFVEQQWLGEDFLLENGETRKISGAELNRRWKITFAETGLDTNTGGRIKKVEKYLETDETFCVTYGDGLSDVNITELLAFHQNHGKLATLTAVQPYSAFGLIEIDEQDAVREFQEKPQLKEWINGGFFVFNREIFGYLEENSVLEQKPLEQLAQENQLMAFRHRGFWKCMDTYKDNIEFNKLWENNPAWKTWKD